VSESCPYCDSELPQQGFYCPRCASPVRCKACGELLLTDAAACVYCGSAVLAPNVGAGLDTTRSIGNAPNKILLKETRSSRSLEASFSDSAVDGISAHLSFLLAAGISHSTYRPPVELKKDPTSPVEQLSLTALQDSRLPPTDTIEARHSVRLESSDAGDDRERLERIFLSEGGRLLLQETRLKAKSKRNYVIRLVCLFLYAHELRENPSVSRSSVNEILQSNGVNDGNARHWIANCDELVRDKDNLRLAAMGREFAKTILTEVFDPSFPDEWTPSSSSRIRNRTAPVGDDPEKPTQRKKASRSGTQPRKEAIVLANAWKEQFPGVVEQSLVFDQPLVGRGLIGLWAIWKIDSGDRATVSRVVLADFVAAAFDVSVNDRNLERSLKNEGPKTGRVRHVGGTCFRITESGIKYVESQIRDASTITTSSGGHATTS